MSGLDSLLEYNEIVRQMFGNEEESFQFYNKYGKEKEFSVRRSYCEWDSGHNEITLRKFVCSREGFREEKELKRESKKRKPRNITRVGCRAKLVIAQDHSTGQWYVKDFIGEHNHPMAEPDVACLLRSHRRISDDQKATCLSLGSDFFYLYLLYLLDRIFNLGFCPIMQDLRIKELQENSATMVKQINYLENKVLTMEAKIEKLEKEDAKPKKHHKK